MEIAAKVMERRVVEVMGEAEDVRLEAVASKHELEQALLELSLVLLELKEAVTKRELDALGPACSLHAMRGCTLDRYDASVGDDFYLHITTSDTGTLDFDDSKILIIQLFVEDSNRKLRSCGNST